MRGRVRSQFDFQLPAYAAPYVCGGTAKRSLPTVRERTWTHPVLCPEDSSDPLHICSLVSVRLMQRQIRLSKFIFVVTLKQITPSSLCEQIRKRDDTVLRFVCFYRIKKNKKKKLLLKISTQKPVQSAVCLSPGDEIEELGGFMRLRRERYFGASGGRAAETLSV